MKIHNTKFMVAAAMATFIYGCSSDSNEEAPPPEEPTTGSITISLTDDPWEDAMEMVLHVTGVEMGHADGNVVMLEMTGGGMSINMMQLQNGESTMLADGAEVPMGQYEWMRLMIDPAQSHIDLASTGGRHGMQMGSDRHRLSRLDRQTWCTTVWRCLECSKKPPSSPALRTLVIPTTYTVETVG